MSNDDILKGLAAGGHSIQDMLKDSNLKSTMEHIKANNPGLGDQLKEIASKNSERVYMPSLQMPDFSSAVEAAQRKNREQEEREKIRTENSSKSVSLQEELVKQQKEMIDILRTKIDTANHTLDALLNSLGANAQMTQEELIKNRKLLVELRTLLETDKSGNSIRTFLKDHGIESLSLLAQLLSMILSK